MSYVNKKIRAFKEAGDIEISRKRSDGRMKTYRSATDARAWCDSTEDRRQHILDLVRHGDGKGLSLGKYIPIEAIIDILLANKNADIKRLQQEIDELKKFIKDHGLKYIQKKPESVKTESVPASSKEQKPAIDGKESSMKYRPLTNLNARNLDIEGGEQLEETAKPEDQLTNLADQDQVEKGALEIDGEKGALEKDGEKRGLQPGAERAVDIDIGRSEVEPTSTTEDKSELISKEDEESKLNYKPIEGGSRGVAIEESPDEAAEVHDTSTTEDTTTNYVTDTSDDNYELSEDKKSVRPPITEDEKKAAEELLAEKSPEEQTIALIEAVEEKEKFCRSQQLIALQAIEQLERIKDIIEDTDNAKKQKTEPEVTQRVTDMDVYHLKRRLDDLKGLEDEVKKLKKGSPKDKDERDKLLAKIAALEKEIDNLKCSLKEMEILRVERNCLKMRVDDLTRIQKDYEDLLKKTQGFDALKADCAMYKAKCEELKDIEAECNELKAKLAKTAELENERQLLMKEIQDCECCMTNQEDEIKRLACHIDCLTQNLDKRQDQMKVKVLTMRAHLEKKDIVIARSEQQLADVQDELRNSIEDLSCETSCLRNHIEELEDQVQEYEIIVQNYQTKVQNYETQVQNYETQVQSYKTKLANAQSELDTKEESNKALIEKLQNEKNSAAQLSETLKQSIRSDEHLKQMLKQAKCAIKCITQKLEKCDIVDMGKLDSERENYLKKMKALEDVLEAEKGNYLQKIKDLEGAQGGEEEMCGADQISELQEELMKSKATIKSLREQLERLTEENEALRKLSTQLQNVAKDQVAQLEDTKDNLSRRSQDMEDKIKDLKSSQAEKDKIIEDLRNELFALKQQLEHEKKLRENAEAVLNELTTSGDSSSAEVAKLKGEINVLNAEIDRLNFTLDNQKKESEDTIHKLQAKINLLEEAAKKAALQTDLGPRMLELEKENADLKTETERLTKENEVLKAELEKLKNKTLSAGDARDNEINRLKQELDDKGKQIKNLQDELNKLKQDLTSKAELEQDNKNLKDEINKLKQDLLASSAKGEDKKLQEEINKLKQDLATKASLEGENKNLKDEINKLKQDLDSNKQKLEQETKKLKDEVNKLTQQLSEKDKEIKNLNDEINKLKKELASKGAPIKDTGSKEADFAKERDDLLKQIAAQKKEIADLLDKIKQPVTTDDDATLKELQNKNKENEKLRATIADLEKQLKDLQKVQLDVPKASPEIEKTLKDLRLALEKEEKKSKELEEALKKCNENSDGLKKRISQLEGENESLKKKPEAVSVADTKPSGGDEDYQKRVKQLEAELAKQKEDCNKMIASLKEQYDRDIKNLQNQNESAISKLQKSHQEALDKLTKQHEEELSGFKDQLHQKEVAKEKPKKRKEAEPKKFQARKQPLNLTEEVIETPKEEVIEPPKEEIKETPKETIVEEVKEEKPEEKKKLSIKTFDEVCICGKLPMVIPIAAPTEAFDYPTKEQRTPHQAMPPCMQGYQQPPAAMTQAVPRMLSIPQPTQTQLMQQQLEQAQLLSMQQQAQMQRFAQIQQQQANMQPVPISLDEKVTSIKKIVELENRLLLKQQNTKQKIDMLQSTVGQFKRELELEKQKNSDLLSRYTNQSKTVADMKMEIDLVKRENVHDKRKLQDLNMTLKNILEGSSGNISPCMCTTKNLSRPHFRTELSLANTGDNRYKNNTVVKRKTCSCENKSSDSFEIDE